MYPLLLSISGREVCLAFCSSLTTCQWGKNFSLGGGTMKSCIKSLDYHNSNAKYLVELQTVSSFYCHLSEGARREVLVKLVWSHLIFFALWPGTWEILLLRPVLKHPVHIVENKDVFISIYMTPLWLQIFWAGKSPYSLLNSRKPQYSIYSAWHGMRKSDERKSKFFFVIVPPNIKESNWSLCSSTQKLNQPFTLY